MDKLSKKQVGEYLLQMFDLSTRMDSSIIKNLMNFSHGINEPIDAVVECCLADYFAKKAAESEYWDTPVSPSPAFQWKVNDDGGKELIRGEELMNVLRLHYHAEIERENKQEYYNELQGARTQEKLQSQQVINDRFKK
ncbi:MAG: hypothetical protein JSV74_04100 [Dehalococcoidia bacterium]|nr:MAG: hypothetical protein JSV74_04100 [Dehalococcoidia bacterium]